MDTKGTLIFFCGKMGAGKTTQSLRLAQELNAVLISEDEWFIEVCSDVEAPHKLFYLKASDEQCLRHLGQRRVSHPERAAFDTEEVFHQVNSYFQAVASRYTANMMINQKNGLIVNLSH